MVVSNGDVIAVILALVAGVSWLVRLEARMSRADERHEELKQTFYRLKDRLEEGKVYVFNKKPPQHQQQHEGDEDA